MKIYINRRTCELLEIPYGVWGLSLKITPKELMKVQVGGYDKKHMDFFEKFGMDKEMFLIHLRFGWFQVCN